MENTCGTANMQLHVTLELRS